MADPSAIHKQVLDLADGVQTLTVQAGALLVAINRDTREPDRIAVWYRVSLPRDGYTGPNCTKNWTLRVAATGQPFPAADGPTLATVVMGPFAWHVIDVDGSVSR